MTPAEDRSTRTAVEENMVERYLLLPVQESSRSCDCNMHPNIKIKLIRSCPNVNTNSDQILIKSGIVRDQRIDCTCCPCIFFCFFSNLIPNGFSFPIPNILIYSFENLGCVRLPPWIVDFRGFLISMDGFFGGCSIASKFPMDDQNPWEFTFCMDFFETVFFRGFFHGDKICNPSHHP